jgi:hypothetical protein
MLMVLNKNPPLKQRLKKADLNMPMIQLETSK